MEDDVERTMNIEEEYECKDDVTAPLHKSNGKEETRKNEDSNESKVKDDIAQDNVHSETVPLTNSANFQNPAVETNGNSVELQKKKKKPLTREV